MLPVCHTDIHYRVRMAPGHIGDGFDGAGRDEVNVPVVIAHADKTKGDFLDDPGLATGLDDIPLTYLVFE